MCINPMVNVYDGHIIDVHDGHVVKVRICDMSAMMKFKALGVYIDANCFDWSNHKKGWAEDVASKETLKGV